MGVAQVAVGSAFGGFVPKFLGDGQALQQTQLSQLSDTFLSLELPWGSAPRAAKLPPSQC